MRALSFFLVIILTSFLACSDDNRDEIKEMELTIASEKKSAINPVSGKLQEYLLIRNNDSWLILNEPIKGFEYEQGYEYVVRVERRKTNILAEDAHVYAYTLIKIESKVLKTSENLPL